VEPRLGRVRPRGPAQHGDCRVHVARLVQGGAQQGQAVGRPRLDVGPLRQRVELPRSQGSFGFRTVSGPVDRVEAA
jgi:hypothetical protein